MSWQGRSSRPEEPISVGELVESLREAVELAFPMVLVRGEVSRPLLAASGHLYFTLKDADGVLPVVMWRPSVQRLGFDVEEGQQLIAAGKLTVYGPRGSYQLVASTLRQERGLGALAAQFEATKKRLAAEGLFDEAQKQGLPYRPRTVVLVTSPTGAVVHDLLDTLLRRCPRLRVRVAPVRVQGRGAAEEIAAALARVQEEALGEVIVVARGGGSLEDLWAFNEEVLARAIAGCTLPVVSAVGHETDFTIADMVADARAKTPTEAAFMVVPDLVEELDMVNGRRRDLERAMRGQTTRWRERLAGLRRSAGLTTPRALLARARERCDQLEARGRRALLDRVEQAGAVRRRREQLDRAITLVLSGVRRELEAASRTLLAVSPRAVLKRGYSITRHADGRVVRAARDVDMGDEIETLLDEGSLTSEVTGRSLPAKTDGEKQ